MARQTDRLSARQVATLKASGYHCDGGGLYLQVSPSGKSWVFRFASGTTMTGNRRTREMGLGPLHTIGLAEARELARLARQQVLAGLDPIEERDKLKRQRAMVRKVPTFREMAEACIEAKRPEWRSAKHGDQWASTLEKHVYPHFGEMPVDQVEKEHVLAALRPIWTELTETATRVRQRVEEVFAYSIAAGHRAEGSNPATKEKLRGLLPKATAILAKKRKHFASIPYLQLGDVLRRVKEQEGFASKALLLTVMTAARSGETRGATWREIDLERGLWSIPGSRMKAGRPHVVPLAKQAIKLLEKLERTTSPLLFPGTKEGRPLSDMSLAASLKRAEGEGTVHGCRSSFSTWAAEQTNFPPEVREAVLAHISADKVAASYMRSDFAEKRRQLLQQWCDFLDKPAASAKVANIGAARAKRKAAA